MPLDSGIGFAAKSLLTCHVFLFFQSTRLSRIDHCLGCPDLAAPGSLWRFLTSCGMPEERSLCYSGPAGGAAWFGPSHATPGLSLHRFFTIFHPVRTRHPLPVCGSGMNPSNFLRRFGIGQDRFPFESKFCSVLVLLQPASGEEGTFLRKSA